jgi:hypothetical protein
MVVAAFLALKWRLLHVRHSAAAPIPGLAAMTVALLVVTSTAYLPTVAFGHWHGSDAAAWRVTCLAAMTTLTMVVLESARWVGTRRHV